MENKTFKPGDIVELKSGSPKMTVVKTIIIGEPNYIDCSWFNGTILETSRFHKDSLNMAIDSRPIN
ncbi:MAG: DUF2158 domain-containing protein [Flavobacteriia bacterium]|nr:DUF2158 domain-containing protein [Flavobacteriia bacterium]